MKAAVDVLLGDGDDEAKVGFDEVFFGAFGLDFAVTDDGGGVAKVGERSAGGNFPLLNFAFQFADPVAVLWIFALFEAMEFGVEMGDLIDGFIDFLSKLTPFGGVELNGADGQAGFYLRPGQLHDDLATRLAGDRILQFSGLKRDELFDFLRALLQLLIQGRDDEEFFDGFLAQFRFDGGTFLGLAEVDVVIDVLFFATQRFGEFDDAVLHHGRAADGAEHPQFAAFHATGEFNFAFAG